MSDNADFRFEVLRYLPGLASPKEPPLELPAALIESFGSINRATERDLLSFKTGDLTLSFRNADGFFDDLFAFLIPKDRWQLRVFRRNLIQFCGVILGLGSIVFDRTSKTCEITAYGLTRQLVDSSAAGLTRGVCTKLAKVGDLHSTTLTVESVGGMNVFDDLHITDGFSTQVTEISQIFYPDSIRVTIQMGADYAIGSQITRVCGFMTVATATATQTTLTLQDPADGTNATAGLLTGDILHITDQVNSEDVTIKQVTSATVIALDSALVNSYAAGSPVTITTPFYRYKTIDYLVRELFKAAGFGMSDLRINPSLFSRPAPTPVNLTGIGLSNRPYTTPAERNSRCYVTEETNGTYYQATPDGDWTLEDATVRPWVDWSRYYLQSEAAPSIFLRSHLTGAGTGNEVVHLCGFDYRPATKTVYFSDGGKIKLRTTADGTTWSAASDLATLPAAFPGNTTSMGCELDPGRQYIYVYGDSGVAREFQVYDIGGAAFTDLKQADDTGYSYYAPVFVPEMDYVLCLRGTSRTGPAFQIAAFRGKTRLWVRPFPNVLIKSEGAGELYTYPTHNLRYLSGALCTLCVQDAASQFVISTDEFRTYGIGQINAGGTARVFGARVLGFYRYFTYVAANPRGYGIAGPFYAGVVNYFDVDDKSVSDGLKELSEVANALFFVDDDGGGHFVARDLYDSGAVLDITPRIKTRRDVLIWDQTASFVEVKGPSDSAVAGDRAFAASGVTIDSPIVPNEAYAQALALNYVDFYGKRRAQLEVTVQDLDGHIYTPMDRVMIDSARYLVYESDHDLTADEVRLSLLEDS